MEVYAAMPMFSTKLGVRRKLLKNHFGNMSDDLDSDIGLVDLLNQANDSAVKYITEKNGFWHNALIHHDLAPKCLPHSLFTYSAFLNMTEEEPLRDFRDDVFWGTGHAVFSLRGNVQKGFHAFLGYHEVKESEDWIPYDTVPNNRNIPKYGGYCLHGHVNIDANDHLSVYADGIGDAICILFDSLI